MHALVEVGKYYIIITSHIQKLTIKIFINRSFNNYTNVTCTGTMEPDTVDTMLISQA